MYKGDSYQKGLKQAWKGEEEGRHSLPFFENWKKCLDVGKIGLDCFHLWVEFSIQNVVIRVSRRKKFPLPGFFSCVFNEIFMEMP